MAPDLTRRGLVAAAAVTPLMSSCRPLSGSSNDPARQPVGFVSHGAPTLALDDVKGADLTAWAGSMAPEDRVQEAEPVVARRLPEVVRFDGAVSGK